MCKAFFNFACIVIFCFSKHQVPYFDIIFIHNYHIIMQCTVLNPKFVPVHWYFTLNLNLPVKCGWHFIDLRKINYDDMRKVRHGWHFIWHKFLKNSELVKKALHWYVQIKHGWHFKWHRYLSRNIKKKIFQFSNLFFYIILRHWPIFLQNTVQ